jgi:site-specific DNA-methyltransferase (adenine-specific)
VDRGRAKSPPGARASSPRAGRAPQAPPLDPVNPPGSVRLHLGDNLRFLDEEPDDRYDLVYVDPPFNTGGSQRRARTRSVRDDAGDHVGFGGRRYRTETLEALSFDDAFDDFLGFLRPRLEALHRVLKPTGSLFVHLDAREVHYVKVMLDEIFGRGSFVNEIIWAYDYGARSRRRWSAKHDTILWYAKDPERYTYEYEAIDRIPYLAPGLVTPEKAARGKTPTDVWWHTIVSPTGTEKTGYPTQKPLGILRRIVRVHSRPGDLLLDCFAGSGSFGHAGAELGRHVTLVDVNPEAHRVMRARLARWLDRGSPT